MTNKLSLAMSAPDTRACLDILRSYDGLVGSAEVRVDQMQSCDLPLLIAESPLPLVITCRPVREGGAFRGPEEERLALLRRAMELGCAYVDVEWDSAAALERPRGSATQVIVSRHWFDRTPPDLLALEGELRPLADVVKLVGTVREPGDLIPVLELLRGARGPVIAIGMGAQGALTRVVAPCFPAALLTYGAGQGVAATAPGQLTVEAMRERYHLHLAGPHTRLRLHHDADPDALLHGSGAPDGTLLDLHLPEGEEYRRAAHIIMRNYNS
ncbi:MAG TPA: type I 3-dehydroquinate dehydratase [Roseiflexaceae bacterium]|nr:type I 3-dehydroquinate dehydratase [Roseiflexaceae bacterium]